MLSFLFDAGDEEAKENTTLQFDLKVKCIKNKSAPKNATDPDELFIHSKGEYFFVYNVPVQRLSFTIQTFFYTRLHCIS